LLPEAAGGIVSGSLGPSGYERDELPGCSISRQIFMIAANIDKVVFS
jgi:hypothetical protein